MPTERLDIIVTDRGTRRVRRNIVEIGQSARQSAGGVNLLQSALAALGGTLILRQLRQAVDAYRLLENRLKIVTNSTAELNSVTSELLRISNETFTKFEGNAELFSRIAFSTRELNRSYSDLLTFQELINKSIIASGASVKEASAGLIQFSQGLASGTLRGDELRAVLEQLPFIADVIAKELGVTRGELRLVGEEGGITADVIVNSFLRAEETIDELFGRIIPTIGQSFQVLSNSAVEFLGEIDKAGGASEAFSRTILAAAENVETLARVLGAGALLGSLLLVRAAIVSITAAIAANPIGALLVSLTAVGTLLTTFSDRLRVSRNGLASLADVAVVLFQDIRAALNNLGDLFSTIFRSIGLETEGFFSDFDFSLRGLTTNAAQTLDLLTVLFIGSYRTILRIWDNLPQVLSGSLIEALNGIVTAQETVINGIVIGFNSLTRRLTPQFEALANLFITIFNSVATVLNSIINTALQRIDTAINAAIIGLNRTIALANRLPGLNLGLLPQVALPELSPPDPQELLTLERGDLDVALIELERIPQVFGQALADTRDIAVEEFLRAVSESSAAVDFVDDIFDRAEARARERAARPARDSVDLNNTFIGGGTLSNAVTRQISELNQELDQQVNLLRLTAEQREVNTRLIEITNDLVGKGLNLEAALTNEQQAGLRAVLASIEDSTARDTLDAIANSLGRVRDPALSLVEAQQELNRQVQLGNLTITEATQLLQALELQELSLVQAQLRRSQVTAQVAEVLDELRGPVIDLEVAQEELKLQFEEGLISLTDFQRAYAQLQNLALSGDTSINAGFIRGLNEILLEAIDSAVLVEDSVVRAFQAMEDALVDFALTGQLSFRDLVDSIIADVARLAVRQAVTLPLANIFSGLFPARQSGGFVTPGQPYLVGERGPELFTPTSSGRIDSNAQTAATSRQGGVTVIMNISTPDADSFRRSRRQITESFSSAFR